ncbi:MAG: glycosyltransferase [Fibrobacteria bacterium]|nr:glycosyltransferase [Fibrobacteria bacterium]
MENKLNVLLLSIVLPFKTETVFLEECIASIRKSTLTEWELLLVSDKATPESVAIAQTFTHLDKRIHILQSPGTGIVDALNFGLEHSSSELVARMDADDMVHPERFKKQVALLAGNPEIALTSCLVKPLSATPLREGTLRYFQWVNDSLSTEKIERDLFIESPLPHPSVMFKKDEVLKLNGYREYDGPEDYDLWIRLKEHGLEFSKVPEYLFYWRIHAKSLSKTSLRYSHRTMEKRRNQHVFWALKKGLAHERDIYIWGAGKDGGSLARMLLEEGINLKGFIDVDPRKLIHTRHSLPVYSPDKITKTPDNHFYISCVSSWNARELIRGHLVEKKKCEGKDFIIL